VSKSNNDYDYGVLLQSNGDIIAYGSSYAKHQGIFAMTRYTPSGSLDTTFGSGGIVTTSFKLTNDGIVAAALQSDGKIVAAGDFHLIRYNTNGSVDQTFGSNGVVTYPSGFSAGSVLIQPSNGDIVLGGGSYQVLGTALNRFDLLRYTPTGALDSTFGIGGEVMTPFGGTYLPSLQGLALENGHIVAGGFVSTGGGGAGTHLWALARYNDDGSLDTTFGPSGTGTLTTAVGNGYSGTTVNALVVQTNGEIVAVGQAFSVSSDTAEWTLARYDTLGNLDSTFGSGGIVSNSFTAGGDLASSAALQANGQIVVVGYNTGFEVGRYNADGSLDTTFGSGGAVTTSVGVQPTGVVIQTNGKIVVAGATVINGKFDFMLARYLPSEPEIGSFTANPNPVTVGSSVTLSASSITDGNPNSTITQVAFYVDSNSDGKLDAGDLLLGYGTQANGVWIYTFTVNLASGNYTLFAQAEDSYGVFGDASATTLYVT